jgi:hypothetical protein
VALRVHLTLQLDDEELLDVDVEDLVEVLVEGRADVVTYGWELPDGRQLRAVARMYDTPNAAPTTDG